jgi:peptidoglycan/LPS O-acetylase OafA/YrhL
VEVWPGGGGLAGVAFFFVLGGFTLTLGYADKVKESGFVYGEYIKRRLIKFYPLHWLILFLFVPLNYLCSVQVSIKTFVPNFLLLQSFIPIKEFYYSYNSPSWYLCNTVFFAVLFPFIYRWLSRIKGIQWVGIAVLYVALIVVECFTPEKFWQSILYINPVVRLFDFMLGVMIAMVYRKVLAIESIVKSLQQRKWLLYVLLFISLTVVIIFSLNNLGVTGRAFAYWLPLVIIILTTSFISLTSAKNFMTNKVLVSLGEVSFALYMIHSLVICVVKVIASKVGINNEWITIPVMLALTIAGSYLVTYLFVNPVNKWLRSKLIKQTA